MGKMPDENQVSRTSSSRLSEMTFGSTPNLSAAIFLASASVDALTQNLSSSSLPTGPPSMVMKYAGMRWPHHSCREMHHSRIFSSQLYQIFLWCSGTIFNLPSRTASTAFAAMSVQSQNHCGIASGSMMSFDREQIGTTIGLSFLPRKRPRAVSFFSTATRASYRFIPENSPQPGLMSPVWSITVTNGRSCRLPHSQSFGSCAGVIFTAPVPKAMSTMVSATITSFRFGMRGCVNVLPTSFVYLASSGCTATAESPSIVSRRVVATTISSSQPSTLYANEDSMPTSTGWS
mmetsp:Transcript_11473/g.29320  ORF Transcript_11473/g.29320 Transcript_11473/m.29320 type:complete len:290 (-) Transcript_11473:1105-1974(-)